MRDCKKFPYTARTCKETFTLLAYETDFDFANKDQPPWSDTGADAYRKIDRLTASAGRFTDNNGNLALNIETRHVPVSRKGVYFAFRDEGACISILAIKVSSLSLLEYSTSDENLVSILGILRSLRRETYQLRHLSRNRGRSKLDGHTTSIWPMRR